MKKKLKFEYCECGCHGHELSVAGQYFWVLNDLKGNLYIHSGHGRISPRLTTVPTWDAVRKYIHERLKKVVEELKEALED